MQLSLHAAAAAAKYVYVRMSGESWRHKSTLSPVPSSQDWACRSSSLLLCIIRLRHFFNICI